MERYLRVNLLGLGPRLMKKNLPVRGLTKFEKHCCRHLTIALPYIYIYISVSEHSFYVVRHLDSIASCLPTGLHLGSFRSRPSLYLPLSFSSVFLVLSFVSASTSMLFCVIFLLPFSEILLQLFPLVQFVVL